jgi:fumarate reductase subunit C
MNGPSGYTPYHPRWIRPRLSTYWWLTRGSYLVFILRELSSIFVAWSIVFFCLLVRAVNRGPAGYQEFLDWSRGPIVVAVNLLSLCFIVFHAVTWFNLAPKAMVVHLGTAKVPGVLIAASNYVAWAIASALVAWLLLRG